MRLRFLEIRALMRAVFHVKVVSDHLLLRW